MELNAWIIRRQNAILISFESALDHPEPTSFKSYAGAVAIPYACAKKSEILNCHVTALYDKDSLSFSRLTICHQPGACANAANDQVVLRPNSGIAFVVASIDFDGVAVPCNLGSLAKCANVASGSHLYHFPDRHWFVRKRYALL